MQVHPLPILRATLVQIQINRKIPLEEVYQESQCQVTWLTKLRHRHSMRWAEAKLALIRAVFGRTIILLEVVGITFKLMSFKDLPVHSVMKGSISNDHATAITISMMAGVTMRTQRDTFPFHTLIIPQLQPNPALYRSLIHHTLGQTSVPHPTTIKLLFIQVTLSSNNKHFLTHKYGPQALSRVAMPFTNPYPLLTDSFINEQHIQRICDWLNFPTPVSFLLPIFRFY